MPEDVAHLYTQHVLKSAPIDALAWMYLDDAGDLMIGIDHYLASYESPRLDLENAIQNLWQFGLGPRQCDDYDFAGQEFGMELRSRRVPGFVGHPAADLISPEATLNPARLHTRNDPDLFVLAPWQLMADEADEMFDLPFGKFFENDYYQDCSTFRMDQTGIIKMFLSDTQSVIAEITGRILVGGVIVSDFQRFDDYPLEAQMGVLDLAYQLGAAKLAGYSLFRMAVGRGEWKSAADYCPDVAEPQRTRWRREMFLKAFEQTKAAAPASTRTAVKPPITPKPPVR
jgi:hypothetical protein